MQFIKRTPNTACKVSLILLDWSVRESFQILYYLERQNIPRDRFEVIVIEYHSRKSPVIQQYAHQVDTWVTLDIPTSYYYHKHFMYNLGILVSQGEIVVICDSDAMVKPTFIAALIDQFDSDPQIVLHLDQFRNIRPDFYPFNYPDFDAVTSTGCINNRDGLTKGVADLEDPLHSRNYGACMCARREDLIKIGGADEHIDYLGHICGPYEMTFRLVNMGLQEKWHRSEFLYHTWHPGQAGVNNYLGPHDGKHMSTTALEALISKRIYPFVENQTLRQLRRTGHLSKNQLNHFVTETPHLDSWKTSWVHQTTAQATHHYHPGFIKHYKGYRLSSAEGHLEARRIPIRNHGEALEQTVPWTFQADSLANIQLKIDQSEPPVLTWINRLAKFYIIGGLLLMYAVRMYLKCFGQAPSILNGLSQSKKFNTRLKQFLDQVDYLHHTLRDLTAILYYTKSPADNLERTPQTVVLTERNATRVYLKLLGLTGLLPATQVLLLRNHDAAQGYLKTYVKTSPKRSRLLLSRDFFIKHYALMSLYRMQQQVLIV